MVMKKVLSVALLMLFIMCFTGCMRINYTVDVQKDGTADLYMTYAVMNTDLSTDGEESSSTASPRDQFGDEMSELEESGWKVSDYVEDDYIGYTCNKTGIPLEDVAKEFNGTSNDEVEMSSDVFSIVKDGSSYTLKWDLGESEEEAEESGEDYSSYLTTYGGYATFTLKLPNKAKSSNATTVSDDGKTLEWDLTKVDGTIDAKFSLTNIKLIITIIVIVFFVALIAFLVLGHLRKNGPGHNEGPNGQGPMNFAGGQNGPGQFQQQGFPQQPQGGQSQQFGGQMPQGNFQQGGFQQPQQGNFQQGGFQQPQQPQGPNNYQQ